MAKSRRNRAARRKDPISKPVKPPTDPELAALRTSKVLPVLADLQSADPKSRSAAATAVSSIITDSRCRKLLLREQVVHIVLTQTLTDAALESRAAGWRILQVLAQEEEADFCVHLYRQDVLTAIEFAAKTVSEKLQAIDAKDPKANSAEKGCILDIASSLVSLLSALAEAQDDILEAISANSTIILMIFGLVTRQVQPDANAPTLLELESLNCLMVLTEDNGPLAKTIAKSDCLAKLIQLKDQTDGSGVLACGVLHNVSASLSDSSEDISAFHDALLIPSLAKTIAQATENRPQVTGAGTFLDPIVCQQHAVEIIASIGTNLTAAAVEDDKAASKSARKSRETNGDAKADNEDEEMEVDDVDVDSGSDGEDGPEDEEDDEMDEDEMAADMDMVTGPDEPENDDHALDDLPALKSLISTSAINHLVRIAALAPSDDLSLQLQSLALSALGNIAWSVSLIDFSDPHNKPIRTAWAPVATAIWEQAISPILASDTADLALATRVTSLAWAVARTLHGDGAPLKPGEHRRFISLYQATKGSGAGTEDEASDPFQALGVKCVGVLGQLALHPAPLDLNREIGTFLVTAVATLPDTPAADAVEALNQIFDIYGDEEYPYDKEVFWQGGFLKHLEESVPKAKAMLKTVDKRAQPELRARADEAVLNLGRFLGYKKKHQS
ncbi:Armadillo-type fold domain containing protein [Sarocladium implicatum]|nr:Armadillo-type fold domain containing protein [Sarocladium implicatum]